MNKNNPRCVKMTKDPSKSGSASVRLRRKREEKEERARERRSVEYRESRESLGESLDTLDHNAENTKEVRNNLRRALRSKYNVQEDSVTIKHFGYIDQPQPSIEVLHNIFYFVRKQYENSDSLTDIWR